MTVLTVLAIVVVVFMIVGPAIIDRFPRERRDRIGACVFIPLLCLIVGIVFALSKC